MEVTEEGEVLKALVDFLYTGSLPREKLQKHVVGLFAAGDNYEIEYLREVCFACTICLRLSSHQMLLIFSHQMLLIF